MRNRTVLRLVCVGEHRRLDYYTGDRSRSFPCLNRPPPETSSQDSADSKPPAALDGAVSTLSFSSLLPPPFRNEPQQSWEDWEEDFTSCASLNNLE